MKINFRSVINSILQNIQIKWLEYIYHKCLRKIINSSTNLNIRLQGIYSKLISGSTLSNPNEAYQSFSEFIDLYTKINLEFEKNEYFESIELKKLMENNLTLSYYIEAETKKMAFKGKEKIGGEDSIKEAISLKSKESISLKLAS